MVFIEKKKLPRMLLLSLSLIAFLLSFFDNSYFFLLSSIFLVLFHNLWYGVENFKDRFVFLFFNITYFLFLLARIPVTIFTNYQEYTESLINYDFGLNFTDPKVVTKIFITLFLGLLFLYIGNITVKSEKFDTFQNIKEEKEVQLVSKLLFYFTSIFTIYVTYKSIGLANSEGYQSLYLQNNFQIPSIIVRLHQMNTPLYLIFLSALPQKRQFYPPTILFIFLGFFDLLTGSRSTAMLNILLVISYMILREKFSRDGSWFTYRKFLQLVPVMVVLIFILNFIAYARVDNQTNFTSAWRILLDFLYNQGVSVNLIGYVQTLQLPEDRNYLFGPIIDYFKGNFIIQSLFHPTYYPPQTLESALYGNSLADAVSYKISSWRYLNGWGYGSSFIAELLYQGGYIGVSIGSFSLGWFLSQLPRIFNKNLIWKFISLFAIRLIYYVPRATLFAFIVSTFSINNIIVVILVLLISKFLKENKIGGHL